jgi:hypothetical protein
MLLAVLAAWTLSAQAAPQAAAPSTPAAKPVEVAPVTVEGKGRDPMVCKSSQPLGSKVPKRTCQKKSEIEQVRQDSREAVEFLQRGKEPFYRPVEP